MSYAVRNQFLTMNKPNETLNPQGVVIHSTATPGATAQNEFNYFNSAYRGASAHYFVDWTEILRVIPDNAVSWGAGPTSNHKYLNIEMCEPENDPEKFKQVWNRTVWLVASLCVKNGWSTGPGVWSHGGVANLWHETNHNDPYPFLTAYGKSWKDLLTAIDSKIEELKRPPDPDSKTQAISLLRQAIKILEG